MSDRKLIIFDFDGTLADTKAAGAMILAEFSEMRNLPHDHGLMSRGWMDPLKYDLGWGVPMEEQPALLTAYQNYSTEQTTVHKRFISPLFAGVTELLEILEPIYDLSVITARDRASYHGIADHNDVNRYFDLYRSASCMVETGKQIKPAPDAVHCLIEKSGHMLENCIVIGDTTADIDMANAAGVKSIAVTWGSHSVEKLAASKPTAIVSALDELPEAIRQIFSE